MKDAHVSFEESLQSMMDLSGRRNFRGCFAVAANMTRLSALLDFKRGVFIAEVLEGVFSQIGPLFDTYAVPSDDATGLVDNVTKNLRALLSDYKGDKARLYDILEDMRSTATAFQIKCTSDALPKDGATQDGS